MDQKKIIEFVEKNVTFLEKKRGDTFDVILISNVIPFENEFALKGRQNHKERSYEYVRRGNAPDEHVLIDALRAAAGVATRLSPTVQAQAASPAAGTTPIIEPAAPPAVAASSVCRTPLADHP